VSPAKVTTTSHSLLSALRLLRERPLLGLIGLLALEFGDEAVLAGGTAAFAIAMFPGTSGGLIVGLYWTGLCVGRIAAPWVLARMPKLVLVLTAALTVGLAILGMARAPTPEALAAALSAGLAVGHLAPTLVSVAADRYPRQMGAAIGVLLSMAQVGGMIMPWLTGRATIAYGHRPGLVIPAMAAFGIAAGSAFVWQVRARTGTATMRVQAE
jgi:fucose permease